MPDVIRLPNTSPHNRRYYTHVRLLTSVDPKAWNAAGFDGILFDPGARVSVEVLGLNPVLLEFAGPQDSWRRRGGQKRQHCWILWRYDQDSRDWLEIARAIAPDWHWALILRDAAIRALAPQNATLPDPCLRGREVTEQLVQRIDAALVTELPAVRALVLTSIYDLVAGRIVAAA